MGKWWQQTDMMLGAAVVAVVAMLVIPIPAFLLDTLLAVSIMISLVSLLTAMYNREATDFGVFPTLLLVTTVFRLALNVSSTRLILLQGPAFEGQLIRAFGEFVVAGDYIIGFVIFIILVLVQMMVITRGATRIGEVAARFALDALPGKQMSIDTDLSSGIISEEEARERREKLQRDVTFYGQMDGATKFVQGDVRVGLIITAINIIGGLIIGVSVRGESFDDALQTYTLLTIGDGLVAQIPSLLITTATGLVVTRSGARTDMAGELSTQLFKNARVLWLTASTLLVASLIPGFPMLPLWAVAGLLIWIARGIRQSNEQKAADEKEKADAPSASPDRFLDDIAVDSFKIEIGYNLIPLVDKTQGGSLIDRITNLRQKFAREMGMVVPPIRINDNMDLDGNEYAFLVGGIEVARSKVFPEFLAALDAGEVREPIPGEPFSDGAYRLTGVLIEPDRKNEAEAAGYLVVDATNLIITHLSEIIRLYATQIMGREEVKMLMDRIKQKYPAVVSEVSDKVPAGVLQAVLHNLLKENVSIRNMVSVLECLADHAGTVKDPVQLTELVRARLGRQIASQYWKDGSLNIIQVDPEIEAEMRGAITFDEKEGRIYALEPSLQMRIRDAFVNSFNIARKSGQFPVFVTSSETRMGVFMILEREISPRQFCVLAYEQLPAETKYNVIGQVVMPVGTDVA